jgi:hypothetical protein
VSDFKVTDLDTLEVSDIVGIAKKDLVPRQFIEGYLRNQRGNHDAFIELTAADHKDHGGWFALQVWTARDEGSAYLLEVGVSAQILPNGYAATVAELQALGSTASRLPFCHLNLKKFRVPKSSLSDTALELLAEKASDRRLGVVVSAHANFRFQTRIVCWHVDCKVAGTDAVERRPRLFLSSPIWDSKTSVAMGNYSFKPSSGGRLSGLLKPQAARQDLVVNLDDLYAAAAPATPLPVAAGAGDWEEAEETLGAVPLPF